MKSFSQSRKDAKIFGAPEDLVRGLEGIAALERKSVEQVAVESLRNLFEPSDSPQAVLRAARSLPHPSAAAVDEMEAAIISARLPVRDPGTLRADPQAENWLANLDPDDRVLTCTIVRGEILFGIARLPAGRRRAELEELSVRFLDAFRCEAVPKRAAGYYADLKLTRQQEGLSLDENDLWVAATALALGATLVTRDSDFNQIPASQSSPRGSVGCGGWRRSLIAGSISPTRQ